MLDDIKFAVRGNSFHTPNCGEFEQLTDILILINVAGEIADLVHPDQENHASLVQELDSQNKLVSLGEKQYLLPGLVDLHIHAPQWPQMGKALHVPLSDWLQNYTFPLEAKYKDTDFAAPSIRHWWITYWQMARHQPFISGQSI